MPEMTLDMIAASLWGLRAEVELQLRSLTNAQRLAEQLRVSPEEARAGLRDRLAADMDEVIRANLQVRRTAQDCAGMIQDLAQRSATVQTEQLLPPHNRRP
jgi:hypothetical protein